MEKRLKAYTIIELLVVLTISSIIISFSTVIILNFGKVFEKGENKINQQTELLSLKQALEKDLLKSVNMVKFENNKIIIPVFNSIITYLFENNHAIREITNSKTKQYFTINNIQMKYELSGRYLFIFLESDIAGNSVVYHNISSKASCSDNEYLIYTESEH